MRLGLFALFMNWPLITRVMLVLMLFIFYMISILAIDMEMRGGGSEPGRHGPRQGEIPAVITSVTGGLQDKASSECFDSVSAVGLLIENDLCQNNQDSRIQIRPPYEKKRSSPSPLNP